MRAVLQRVSRASVSVEGQTVGSIAGPGLVALVAVTHDDGPAQVQAMARKIAELRILPDELSVLDLGAPVLLISQFTLYGQTAKGRRPSWSQAAPAQVAQPLIEALVEDLRVRGLPVETGVFGAAMSVELVNDGPFTVIVEV